MAIFSGEQLANSLKSLGVDFILGGQEATDPLKIEPPALIAALAESAESRLRLSLIPLFLQYPEFAKYVGDALQTLAPPARVTLQCYYTAAHWLQQKYRERLLPILGNKPDLPDLFSKELDLPRLQDLDENLRVLADRHEILSGKHINWLGTYEHGAQRYIIHLERIRQCSEIQFNRMQDWDGKQISDDGRPGLNYSYPLTNPAFFENHK